VARPDPRAAADKIDVEVFMRARRDSHDDARIRSDALVLGIDGEAIPASVS